MSCSTGGALIATCAPLECGFTSSGAARDRSVVQQFCNVRGMDRRSRPRPQRVLVVDDAQDLRELWKAWLTIWGFTAEEARNGQEAVTKARAFHPDLILMDIAMPVLDGLSATALLRRHPETSDIPILAMSANLIAATPEDALEHGCNSFLPKPVTPEALLDEIRAALRRTAMSSSDQRRRIGNRGGDA